MKNHTLVVLALITAAASPLATAAEQRDTVRQTFVLSGGAAGREVEIDNIFGSVVVTGHPGDTVELVAQRRIEAKDEARLQDAIRDVRLDISQAGNRLKIVVDGPFRNSRGGEWNRLGYRVTYDFDLKVPVETGLKLKTVNSGQISVANVTGQFDLRNVNGGIEMKEVAGSGSAATVNGPLRALFRAVPEGKLQFKSVNGELEATFPPALHADVHLKTLNGDLLTDFEATMLPTMPLTGQKQQGRTVYRSKRGGSVRIGSGGTAEMTFETVNGNILVLKRDR